MNFDRLMVPEEWQFGYNYCYGTKEECVRASKRARNEGFKVEFLMSGDPDYPYAFCLVDPFEGKEW